MEVRARKGAVPDRFADLARGSGPYAIREAARGSVIGPEGFEAGLIEVGVGFAEAEVVFVDGVIGGAGREIEGWRVG